VVVGSDLIRIVFKQNLLVKKLFKIFLISGEIFNYAFYIEEINPIYVEGEKEWRIKALIKN
jgi:hypothetical protein